MIPAGKRVFCLAVLLAAFALTAVTAAAASKCGDHNRNGTVTAPDALAILRVSVGSLQCDDCVCDVDRSGAITAKDALMVLKVAVGLPIGLNCRPCALCGQTSAPQCGGDCESGRSCVVDPWDETGRSCDCLTQCELSAAPACGGGCEGSVRPDDVCTNIRFTLGRDVADLCQCIPPGTRACADTAAPACGGVCASGHRCALQSGKCRCVQLPVQGSCAKAAIPACGGTCPSGSICQASGEKCVCGPQTGESPCYDATDPACGAPCGNGDLCATGIISGCDCVTPCEVSDAPGCGGSCLEAGSSCVAVAATLGDSTIALCQCR